MKKYRLLDRHVLFPNVIIISHPMSWGGAFKDHHLWMAELDGEVQDYDCKDALVRDAQKEGKAWMVIRVHRRVGLFSIVEGQNY